MSPVEPQSAEFDQQLSAAGEAFGAANVAAIYCVHGTFVGNDVLGLLTELSRFTPSLSRSFSRVGKRVIDIVAGEAGNYTRGFTQLLENELEQSVTRKIPVRLFHWSSQNNHIARADGAIRLIAELADQAARFDRPEEQRVQLWGHSHGGNVLALVSQVLGADCAMREEFFEAARSFYNAWVRRRVDMPVWQRVREILDDENHPVRQISLDMVTYGTPIRYGWHSGGYANLLHFVHHRPPPQGEDWQAPIPLKLMRARKALDGDYVQQIGIAGTNFMPLPIAVRTWLADRRLHAVLQNEMLRENIIARLRRKSRVPDEGTTLLVDYDEINPWVTRHIFGHGLYTLRKWLPFHCQEIAKQFYA